MKSIYVLIPSGLLLPLLNRFYELTSMEGSSIVHTEVYRGQTYGIIVCLLAAIIFGRGLHRVCKERGCSWRSIVRLRGIFFALPILWQNWSMGQFMSGVQVVTFKRGIGGTLTSEYFIAAAIALCLLDSLLSSGDLPRVRVMPAAVSA